ncbi:LOW QUALITY PROTEIN: hypothetical protein ACHAW6_000732, partial [Cyclotella cf. meneghiniana]
YLGYILSKDGIKQQAKKLKLIFSLTLPINFKELHRFLGMILLRSLGMTQQNTCPTHKPCWQSEVHQKAFDDVKATIPKDVSLAYPDCSKGFEICFDANLEPSLLKTTGQLLFLAENFLFQKYSLTKFKLLAIVKTLKEFKGMLWVQKLVVYTDHKNLILDALGLTCDRVYCWRLLLEEYGPD